jgi:hypothetical protein
MVLGAVYNVTGCSPGVCCSHATQNEQSEGDVTVLKCQYPTPPYSDCFRLPLLYRYIASIVESRILGIELCYLCYVIQL